MNEELERTDSLEGHGKQEWKAEEIKRDIEAEMGRWREEEIQRKTVGTCQRVGLEQDQMTCSLQNLDI